MNETINFNDNTVDKYDENVYNGAVSKGWTINPPLTSEPDPGLSYIKFVYPSSVTPLVTQVTITDPESKAHVEVDGNTLYVRDASTVTNAVYTSADVTEVYCNATPNIQYIGTAANSNKQAANITSFIINGENNITNASSMFKGCSKLTTVAFNTSKVTNMNNMFENSGIVSVPKLDLSSVEHMDSMFYGSAITEIPDLSTMTKQLQVNSLFYSCNSLVNATLDCSHFNGMVRTFMWCENLETVSLTNTGNLTLFGYNMAMCPKLKSVGEIDLGSVTTGVESPESANGGMNFTNSTALETANIKNLALTEYFMNMGTGAVCKNLSKESIHTILSTLQDVSNIVSADVIRGLAFAMGNDQDIIDKIDKRDYVSAINKGWFIMPALPDVSNAITFTYKNGTAPSDISGFTFVEDTNVATKVDYSEPNKVIITGTTATQIIYPNDTNIVGIDIAGDFTDLTSIKVNGNTYTNGQITSLEKFNIFAGQGDIFNSITDTQYMFYNCNKLTKLTQLYLLSANMDHMFDGCTTLETINGFDMSNVTTSQNTFDNCASLKNVELYSINTSVDFSSTEKFTNDTVHNLLTNLNTVTTNQTITFNDICKDYITADDYTQAQGKGWNIVPSKIPTSYAKFTYKSGSKPASSNFTITGTGHVSSIDGQVITFSNIENVTNIVYTSTNIIEVDIKNGTNLTHIGIGTSSKGCQQPTSITKFSLSGPHKITKMTYLFNKCTKLTSIPELNIDTATLVDYMFAECTSLTTIPALNTEKVTSMAYMFYKCGKLTSIPELNTANVQYMNSMFESCTGLTGIPKLNTSKVTNMNMMFGKCSSLTAIPELDTSNAVDMGYMFGSCTKLTSIPELNTPKATQMSSMFQLCTNLTTIPLLNTSKVTNMSYMFASCPNLASIHLTDTSNVTNMKAMFYNSPNLLNMDISNFNTSKVTDMGQMFYGCDKLTSIPELNTINVSMMNEMFKSCTLLTTIPLLNTSNVIDMGYMFEGCSSLESVPNFNTGKVLSMKHMFSECGSLLTIPQLNTINVANMEAMFKNCTNVTGVLDILYDGDVSLSFSSSDGSIFDGTTKPITMRYKSSNTKAEAYAAPSNVTKEVIA